MAESFEIPFALADQWDEMLRTKGKLATYWAIAQWGADQNLRAARHPKPMSNPSQVRSSLVSRVQALLQHSLDCDARPVIREVAVWLMERGYRTEALLLNDEADR